MLKHQGWRVSLRIKERAGRACFWSCLMPAHTDLKCEDELIDQVVLLSSFLMVILCLRAAASMLLSECVILPQYICINVTFVPWHTWEPACKEEWGQHVGGRNLYPSVSNTEHILLLNWVYTTQGCGAYGSQTQCQWEPFLTEQSILWLSKLQCQLVRLFGCGTEVFFH